jgi:thiopurine S-methyltransferase
MDPDFWQQRWREGRIGFHQPQVTPLLEQYWDAIGIPDGARVLVPLAGKSLDLLWLAGRGHRVLGVELSPIAVRQFFAEHDLEPRTHASASGLHHVAGDIEIILGDVFALEPALVAGCTGLYDRAALIALPPTLRERYARDVYGRLPAGCRGLLVTLEYPQHEKQGPPFSVPGKEVHARFGADWALDLFERRDILDSQPGFAAEGVSALHTSAWGLRRR